MAARSIAELGITASDQRLPILQHTNAKCFDGARDEGAIKTAQDPTWRPLTAFFEGDSCPGMIKKGKRAVLDYWSSSPELEH